MIKIDTNIFNTADLPSLLPTESNKSFDMYVILDTKMADAMINNSNNKKEYLYFASFMSTSIHCIPKLILICFFQGPD